MRFVIMGALCLLLMSNLLISSVTQDYEPQTVVVKFRQGSDFELGWKANGRTGEIEGLKAVIGENTSSGYISDGNLLMLSKRIDFINNPPKSPFDKGGKPLNFSNSLSAAENLSRICVIKYQSQIDPLVAARKLSTQADIEYAEPLYIQRIVDIPNDSLLSYQNDLPQIHIFEAWDALDTGQAVIVGIVDTGVDYLHEDLAANIFENPGETGLDSLGRDKRTNGVDDDHNGYVDDWHGWDFVSSQNPNGDNDPMPGHEHGTHVAGIVGAVVNNHLGIAGISKKVKILPVKVADDNPYSTSITNGYDGMLYAALMGAGVINCSWGSSSKSDAELDVLNTVVNMGTVVVAAAGNDGRNIAFYPSAHDGVLSVVAVDSRDIKADFSNFHNSIDVSAPGVDILSTIPNNSYTYLSGTSMSSPVAAGVAALVRQKFPDYSQMQVMEQIKASSDNIDSLNPYFIGEIGRGRVNAYKAVTGINLKSVKLNNYQVRDNNDSLFDRGDTISINMKLLNVLSPLADAWIITTTNSIYNFSFLHNSSTIGNMGTMELKNVPDTIRFIIPDNLPSDYNFELEVKIFDDTNYVNSEFIDMNFRPSYRTMDANNISVTFNSIGNIGYNDYPSNTQGDGFNYKDSKDLLFEGALLIGRGQDRISDVARGDDQTLQDGSFSTAEVFHVIKNGGIAAQEGYADFHDNNSTFDAGVSVSQKVYQFDDSLTKDFIIIVYDIINNSGEDTDSLYASLFLDWDIGPSGMNNIIKYDNDEVFGYAKNVADTSYPMIGTAMISSHKLDFYAIDNGGARDNNGIICPSIWNGFSKSEKWMMMSNGILRKQTNVTDASLMIGAGPIELKNGDTTRVAFSLFGGKTLDDLKAAARFSRETAIIHNLADGTFSRLPQRDTIFILYPNPVSIGDLKVDFGLTNSSYLSADVVDILGKIIETPIQLKYYSAGYYTEFIPTLQLSQGRYYLKMTTSYGTMVEPFEIMR